MKVERNFRFLSVHQPYTNKISGGQTLTQAFFVLFFYQHHEFVIILLMGLSHCITWDFFLEFPYFCEESVIILSLIEISASELEIMSIKSFRELLGILWIPTTLPIF